MHRGTTNSSYKTKYIPKAEHQPGGFWVSKPNNNEKTMSAKALTSWEVKRQKLKFQPFGIKKINTVKTSVSSIFSLPILSASLICNKVQQNLITKRMKYILLFLFKYS